MNDLQKCPACSASMAGDSDDRLCSRCGTWISLKRRDFEYTSEYASEREHEHPDVREQKAKTLRYWLRFLPSQLPGGARTLEWGFGGGGTLEVLLERKLQVYGVEATPSHLATARSLGVPETHLGLDFTGFLGKPREERPIFDLVLYLDSFEHLLDPDAHLSRLNQLTQSGSRALVVLPRADCISRRLLGRAWPHDLPDHWIFYSRRGLLALWASHGWKPVKQFHPSKYLSSRTIQKHVALKFSWFPTGVLTHLPNLWFNVGEMGFIFEKRSE